MPRARAWASMFAAAALAACGDDRPRATVPPVPVPVPAAPDARDAGAPAAPDAQEPVMSDAAAAVPMEYEGLTLGTTLEAFVAHAAAAGWRQNAQPTGGDQSVTVFTTPDHPVKRYRLQFEASKLINVEIDYRQPDPARAALRERFAHARDHQGEWYLTDDARTVLASVKADGSRLRALHIAVIRDQREATALLRAAFGADFAAAGR